MVGLVGGALVPLAVYRLAGAIFLTYNLIDKNGTKSNIERTRVLLPRSRYWRSAHTRPATRPPAAVR
jgi:hypothetical protein